MSDWSAREHRGLCPNDADRACRRHIASLNQEPDLWGELENALDVTVMRLCGFGARPTFTAIRVLCGQTGHLAPPVVVAEGE